MTLYKPPEQIMDLSRPFYIYGVSAVTISIITHLKALNKSELIVGIIDNIAIAETFFGFRLTEMDSVVLDSGHSIMIASYNSYFLIRERLLNQGVFEGRILPKPILACMPSIGIDGPRKNTLTLIDDGGFARSSDFIKRKWSWYGNGMKNVSLSVIRDFKNDAIIRNINKTDNLILALNTGTLPALRGQGLSEIYSADPLLFGTVESMTLARAALAFTSEEMRHGYRELSRRNFNKLLDEIPDSAPVNLYCTGPSALSHDSLIPRNGVNFICNSLVKSHRLVKRLKPRVCFFSDPVFHFSHCAYAVEFRSDLMRLVREFEPYLLLPFEMVPLFLNNYPGLESLVIGLSPSAELQIPTVGSIASMRFENVLTSFMLPFAAALSCQLRLTGCDGRSSVDKLFWSHSQEAQYTEHYQSAIDAHPSFFRDRDFNYYFKKHCDDLNRVLIFLDARGIRVDYFGETLIPALQQRRPKDSATLRYH